MIENGPRVPNGFTDTISAGAGEIAYSKAFDLCDLSDFALEYKADCTGTPSLKIEIQQSSDGSDWYVPTGVEALVEALADKTQHGISLNNILIPVRFVRIKITELTTTVSDSVITVKLSVQKKYSA